MALFKVNRGNSTTLPATLTDGWAYFCTDTGEFFIDYADAEGNLFRKQINAENAIKASQDANGNDITLTYETKEDAESKLESVAGYTHSNIYYKKIMIDSKDKAINKKISNISKTITEQNIDTAFNDIFGGE